MILLNSSEALLNKSLNKRIYIYNFTMSVKRVCTYIYKEGCVHKMIYRGNYILYIL